MRLQIRQLRKGLVAAGVAAFVGLVASVRSNMLLQVGELGEFALANLTPVRLDTCDTRSGGETDNIGMLTNILSCFTLLECRMSNQECLT